MSKSMSAAVGRGGANRETDVVVIQYLLNCVPTNHAGPQEELVLDGLCGPKTQAAILCYQQSLGYCDGRVDPAGPTFGALSEYDPYPNQKLNLQVPGHGHAKGTKRGGTPSTNSWDPWGYYNPAGKNYMKNGLQPPTNARGWKGTSTKQGGHNIKGSSNMMKLGDRFIKSASSYRDNDLGWKVGGKQGLAPGVKSSGLKQGDSADLMKLGWGPVKGGIVGKF